MTWANSGEGRVAARHHGELAAVELGSLKTTSPWNRPTKTMRPPWAARSKVESIEARLPVASNDDVGQTSPGRIAQGGDEVAVGSDRHGRIDPHDLAAEASRASLRSATTSRFALPFQKTDDTESRSGRRQEPDDVIPGDEAAVHGVLPDAEHLDEGELVEGGRRGAMEFCQGHVQLGAQASVAMHPEDAEGFAAVRLAAAGGGRGGVVQVGLDRDGPRRAAGPSHRSPR